MKRNLARNINKDNKKVNEQIAEASVKVSDVGNKLLIGDALTLENINELGQRIAEQQEYDKNQLIVCDITALNERLELHKDDNINEKPIFIICHSKHNVRATFCIVKQLDKTICLYQDFSNIQIPENIKNILAQYFDKDIEFKIHAKIAEIKNQKDEDILSLTTLKTMMVYLKSDNKKDFIEGFANPKKTFFGWFKNGITSLKKELFSLVEEGYYKIIASDIDQLSRETEFKKAIKELINNIPLIEEVDNFKSYQLLLKEFVEMEENEIDTDTVKIKELETKLEEAREKAFSKTKALKIGVSKNKEGNQQLDIVKNFPTQMDKFTKIFEPLTNSTVDEKLDKALEEISSKLDLEYDKLKGFFRVTEEKKQDDNYNTSSVRNIEDVISVLPKAKSYDTNLINTNKPFEKLLSEIGEESDVLNIKSSKEGYNKVKEFYELWENKEALEINQWAVSKKGQLADTEIYEALAIMDRANELVTGGHKLRDTQILAILTFLQQKDKGQLSQIQTGEGKTTIVSILAAIKALQGGAVDVITSNPVLASDGIKDKKLFYDLLNLNATTNNLDENYKSGERECYKSDIVYGSISNFQFDYLKDSFLGLGTRAGRAFESIILDEVDSMIIDNASHIAKLSGPLAGMESLKYVYIKIWQALYKAEEKIVEEFQKELKRKAQELQELPDSEEAQLLYEQFKNELQDSIIPKIKDYIKSSNPTKIDIIPSHIQEYADNSLDRWINSAIDAKFNYHEDEQYIIRSKDGEEIIQPVDYANTGITLKNTIWQYGLHQFLQLKHNLHLTSESLTSCFISNLSYINKYGKKIFGLTGTLGSTAEQELLSSIYNVGYAKIPTYKEKKFIEIDGEVVDDEIFSKKVADDTIAEIKSGRSSLIICETIKDAKTIQEILKSKNQDIIIRTFFDEENAHITKEEIKPGEVVIATNIAGRGTDFKTSVELENNGGLHVCVAFLPCNKRVEDQAFGRTARQGNNGTAKLMIKKSAVEKLGINSYSFTDIKLVRDLREEDRIAQIKEIKILELKFQDRLFELFSDLYRKLKREGQSKGEYKYVLDDLKEFWAFWLEKQNFKGLELANKSPEEEFRNFESEACKTISGEIKFNPYYSIQQAEHFISNEELDKAEQALNHAIVISKNPEILHSAYIKLFEIAIEKGRVFIEKCQKAVGDVFVIPAIGKPDGGYKENAKKYLEQAKAALKKELDYIENLFKTEEFTNILKSDDNNESRNLFIKHIVSKQQALNLNMQHADSLVQQIDNHKGGISIGGRVSDYFANLKPQNDHEEKIKDTIANSELSELAAVGTNTTYTLREVHDVCPEIAQGAQIQIGGGIALLATGFCFPPALPITSAIGGTMITEGVCDVAIELINKNSDGKFHKEAYIKGKVISYGVSILTMGISAAMQCPKILNTAKKACRWISETLRKCPFLQTACEFLATKFDKLGNWFEKMETIAKFSNMSKVEKLKYVQDLEKSKDLTQLKYLGENIKQIQDLMKELKEVGRLTELTHFEKCISTLQQVAISTVKNVTTRTVENAIMGKVVTPALSSLMSGLKPTIKKHVDKSIRENIDQEKLKSSSYEDMQNIIKEIRESIDYETVMGIFKDAVLGITKYCSNWQVQLGALAVDQYISWKEVYNYAKDLCKKINDKLKSTGKSINQNIDELINQLIEQLSEEMYSQVVSTTTKTCKDVYLVGKSAYTNYKQEKQEEAKCLEVNKDFKEGGLAGQEQAKALSDVIKRPVHIYEESGNIIVIGEQYLGTPIKVSYFPADEHNPTGHYVPYGKNENWSSSNGKNNCLFDAVGSQIGKDSSELRTQTIQRIESDATSYIVSNVLGVFGTELLLKGGTPRQYEEDNTSSDAGEILDGSQYKPSQSQVDVAKNKNIKLAKGHPRAHALSNSLNIIPAEEDFDSEDKISCAENITKVTQSTKTAFISRKQQDSIANEVLKMSESRDAIERLNQGELEVVVSVPTSRLEKNKDPMMYKVSEGNVKQLQQAKGIKIILGHHEGKQDDPDVYPHIKTMYPTNKEPPSGLQGIDPMSSNIGWICSYFGEYTIKAIEEILKLRINNVSLEDVNIVRGYILQENCNNLQRMIADLIQTKSKITLAPLNLYNKHAVGVICIKDQGNNLQLYYLDSSNEHIPETLKQMFIDNSLQIIQLPTKQQSYANCGPELIENFILYLTGDRASEDKAIELHSKLVENELLEKGDLKSYLLFGQSTELLGGISSGTVPEFA
ncbi:preprotein translocase subunit SecA [Rickettsia amblyommatis]|uniref:Preprotein translocase SecA subunit-like protein n=1 Tax=Rickettsia amblyommatis (strain GAT-30V) TaxID=1105111 RepID=H8K2J0_RICAG|nr:hypothetical protein [Rickettsia amblyommatis]AFC70032.1 preprotein translocase SecA subunit-like protein [Rickettsia amblyommatis str. GAT-30V]ARD87080.1 preprotein translocase subunit SecA [Rickettsia amblyommatis]KJV90994.1 secA DEAD-like domain protein [Rickettsia amblyommatis str. Darkwater]